MRIWGFTTTGLGGMTRGWGRLRRGGYGDGQNVFQWLGFDSANLSDPLGREIYVVFRELNRPLLKITYPVSGHFYLVFDEGGLTNVMRWRRLVTRIGGQRLPRRQGSPNSETFSFHPWAVRRVPDPNTGNLVADKSHNVFGTQLTLGSYIGYNDPVDRESFLSWRDGRTGLSEARDARAWPVGLTQSQQEVLYQLAIQSRNINNDSPHANDMGWYRLNENNCGTWARFMIERVGLEFPEEAKKYNLGIGLDETSHQMREAIEDAQVTPGLVCTPRGCVRDGVPLGLDGNPISPGVTP